MMQETPPRVLHKIVMMAAFVCVLCAAAHGATAQDEYPKVSPFEAVRFADDLILVQVNGSWYELLKINDADAFDVLEHCHETYGALATKRFTEDLVQVLTEYGHRPKDRVDLTIRKLVERTPTILKDVIMTKQNRQKILEANRRNASKSNQRDVQITRGQAAKDIAFLRLRLENQYAYLHHANVDVHGMLDALADSLGESVNVAEFAISLQKFLSRFGDGHTRVNGSAGYLPQGYLPFAVELADTRIVAFDPNTKTLLRDDAPYVAAIDGIEIDSWLKAAGTLVADGSASLQTSDAVRRLVFLNWLRNQLDLPITTDVTVQLAGRMHMGLETVTLPVADEPIIARKSPLTQYEFVNGDMLVLRIPSFSTRNAPKHVERCIEAMEQARTASGLIIDVRGNSGGSRRALKYLLPYFMNPDEPPVVVNTAKYRLAEEFEQDHLANRFLHRPDAPHWTDDERAAIKEFAATFEPQWQPPSEFFSDWHYMVVRQTAHADVYHFTKPVVILMDRECFSATDIFLGAFKGRENVTLLGTPSGGGSGRSITVRLPHSGIRLSLSSMASFQPNGKLYDGNGIEPDIVIEPTASDVLGRTDTQMEAALRILLQHTKRR